MKPSVSLRLVRLCAGGLLATSIALAAPVRTPEFTEGPFYTFNPNNTLPDRGSTNRDNDLTRVDGAKAPAKGTPFLLSGVVRDLAGQPVAGAKVELWQTDEGGAYYHSGDSRAASRDPNFQHYGESVTDTQGRYSFRTVYPGLYTGRIRHFHFKVKQGDATVLTSQFIFDEERSQFARDGVTARASGPELEAVVLAPKKGADAAGADAMIATKDIVIDPTARSTNRGGPGPNTKKGRKV
jgi:protocatechuate 3,4-dioxygenase beta subunit